MSATYGSDAISPLRGLTDWSIRQPRAAPRAIAFRPSRAEAETRDPGDREAGNRAQHADHPFRVAFQSGTSKEGRQAFTEGRGDLPVAPEGRNAIAQGAALGSRHQ